MGVVNIPLCPLFPLHNAVELHIKLADFVAKKSFPRTGKMKRGLLCLVGLLLPLICATTSIQAKHVFMRDDPKMSSPTPRSAFAKAVSIIFQNITLFLY